MVRVTVLYFSTLRQALGQERESVDLPAQSTAREILTLLSERHPTQAAAIAGARLAVDQAFAFGQVTLREGAELAVITAVSGG
ncbi:MAG: hypothetical protein RL199_1664 [Pseudomonadota bacterium]|jgi:molybdopterin converting factor small subunit